MDQIASAVTQIEHVTQESAANAEEAAAASEELTAQASELQHIMRRIMDLAGLGARAAAPQANQPAGSSRSAQTVAASGGDDPDFRPF
jgi:methyl-accepting chemotaxis protein